MTAPDRILTLADMASLPWPSDAQIDAFVEHLCWAHSWYKHLPFDESARFVVFLAPDAAAGYETQERLHYGWKTTAQYRERYGLMDFTWQVDARFGDPNEYEGWQRDGGTGVEPSPELLAIAGFNLGPTCSSDDNAIDVICDLWPVEANFESAAAQAPFEKLTELYRQWGEAYGTLDEDERSAVAGLEMGYRPTAEDEAVLARPRVVDYRVHADRLNAHYGSLRAPQVARIRDAIARLRAALAGL